MRLRTATNHRDRLLALAIDCYYFARMCAQTHKHLLSRLQERVYSDPAWERVPGWVRQSVIDRTQLMSRDLYRPSLHGAELERMLAKAKAGEDVAPVAYLRWALRVDGAEVTSGEICARREAGDEGIWKRVQGAHVWNHQPDKAFAPWEGLFSESPSAEPEDVAEHAIIGAE